MAAIRRRSTSSVRWQGGFARGGRARLALYAAVLPLAAGAVARGAEQFWDINGTTAGAGSAPTSGTSTTVPNGTWDASTANWGDEAGTAVTGTWHAGNVAVFSAGTTATGGFTVTVDGTHQASGIRLDEGTVTLAGTGTVDGGSAGLLVTNNRAAGGATLIFGVPVAGSGDVTVRSGVTTGSTVPTVNFTVQNTFTGNLNIEGGTSQTLTNRVQIDYGLANPNAVVNFVGSYAELGNTTTAGTPSDYTFGNAIRLNSTGDTSKTYEAFIASSNGKTVTYAGVISGTSNLNISLTNAGGRGTVVLGAQNQYVGDTYVNLSDNNGLLKLGVDNALPAATNLTFGGTSAGAGTNAVAAFDMNGKNLTVASLATNTSGSVRGIYNTSASPSVLTIDGGTNTTYKGVIGNTAVVAPFTSATPFSTAISLVKAGSGSLTLTGGSKYTGTTTVTGGSLVLGRKDDLSSSTVVPTITSPVTVSGAGTLASVPTTFTGLTTGDGVFVDAPVTIGSGGTLAPGGVGGIGALATFPERNVSFEAGSTLKIDWKDSGTFDVLRVGGNLNLSSGSQTIELSLAPGASAVVPGTYNIAQFFGTNYDLDHQFNVVSNLGSGFTYSVAPFGSYLQLNIMPQATTYRWTLFNSYPVVEGGDTWTAADADNFIDLANPMSPVAWSNSAQIDVVIGGDSTQVGGVIVLGDDIVINGRLTFSPVAAPYTLGNGPEHTLTLASGVSASSSGVGADTGATINAPVVLSNAQTWTVNGSNVLNVTQTLTGGTHALTKDGAGILNFGTAGGTLGSLSVTGGAVLVGAANAIGASTPVTLDGGGYGGSASATLVNPITIGTNGGTLVAAAGTQVTMTANISAAGAVTKNGAGVLTLTGTNTFPSLAVRGSSGTDASYVAVASTASLGAGPITLNGGGLRALADLNVPNDVTLQGTGTTGSFNRVDLNGKHVTLSGVISGSGDWVAEGTGGSFSLTGTNTYQGGAFFMRTDAPVNALSASALGAATIYVGHANATLNVPGTVTAAFVRGDASGVLHKTGTGTFVVGGVGSPTAGDNNPGSTLSIDQGVVEMRHQHALGGNADKTNMHVLANPGTELVMNYNGTRQGGSITVDNATITRPATASPGEAAITTWRGGVDEHGSVLTVKGNSTIQSLAKFPGGQVRVDQVLGFNMPVVVKSGATLTIHNANDQGDDENNLIAFRGTPNLTNAPNGDFTIEAGATVDITGPGQVRFGRRASEGKPIVGQGVPGQEAVLKLSKNTYLDDVISTNEHITRLVVSGSGNAGLRVEAPMNATYTDRAIDGDLTKPDGTTGLFRLNETGTATGSVVNGTLTYQQIGNSFTVFSPLRATRLSHNTGSPVIPRGGTLTLAANDSSGATGVVDNGPSDPTAVALALDNTTLAGNLVYRLDGEATNGPRLGNFASLTLQRTGNTTASVKGELKSSTRLQGLSLLNGTSLDVADKTLLIDYVDTTPANIVALVMSGRNGGAWNGVGINSSTASGDAYDISGLALVEAADFLGLTGTDTATYAGHTVDATTLAVKYALYGDLDLSGSVDGDDYVRMDRAYAMQLPAKWLNGDFNYDNAVNTGDYLLMDTAFIRQSGGVASAEFLAQREAQFGAGYVSSLMAAVPEPTALGLLVAVVPMIGRRRRSR